MPCRCQSNMSFADANYLYRRRQQGCPYASETVTAAETTETETSTAKCSCCQKKCGCKAATVPCCCRCCKKEQTEETNPCCACNGCSCVTSSCLEETVIPCTPIDCMNVETQIEYRTCCDPNGKCCRYPCCCRNPYWPSFAHPRWLCCKDLYNVD